ncbi:hypothetical protein SeMB42_g04038 [Synchytrium endobioticum]|uniref:Phosphorylase kinase alphabeta n=1 Tax=Synchytrium endobioticum TaxID=286115 RepID=A0A507D1K6_9FUNG|nr:hypothetical protein SeMB42_g04038 [Synchytrium endobioticum]
MSMINEDASVSYEARRRHILNKLDVYFQQVSSIILSKQSVAGLIPASVAVTTHGDYRDAWVRDNVYSILAVWGVSLGYRRIDDESGRGYELEHATIKCMRGLLFAMMRQSHKVEKFKNTQLPSDALHAKYNTSTGETVVGDADWGHLQIDATSLFLLYLAQMTASGLQIVYTMDEVHFIQNLVFYLERAYRTPDYGIWERGNKINHGMPELNSSSIGMAVAALQAINGINLYGARGGSSSVIHVLPDEITRNVTTLYSALPRESNSKEVDAAILSVISFPAFAVADHALVNKTREEIVKKLEGRYGMKRFLRDGHQTVLEDNSRLHYDAHELRIFEHIESEWPLFFTYMVLDGYFRGDITQAEEYLEKLAPLLVDSSKVQKYKRTSVHRTAPSTSPNSDNPNKSNGLSQPGHDRRHSLAAIQETPELEMKLVPELYIVPKDLVNAEKANPGSQIRVPNENIPLVWAQSLYILGNLLKEKLITPAELDPLGRRFAPSRNADRVDTVVQVVLLAENADLQARLATFGLDTQTRDQCEPVTISPPSALRDAFVTLGANTKLGLTGRPLRPIGTLSTSKMYKCRRLYCFLPHFMDKEEFYLVSDNDYLVSVIEQELAFVKNNWSSPGRPTIMIMLTKEMMLGTRTAHSQNEMLDSQRRPPEPTVNTTRNLLNFFMSLRSGSASSNSQLLTSTYYTEDPARAYVETFKLHDSPSQSTPATPSAQTTPDYKTSPNPKQAISPETLLDGKEGTDPTHSPASLTTTATTLPLVTPVSSNNINSELLTLTLGDPSHIERAIKLLSETANLYDQIDLLHYLHSCNGLDFSVGNLGTVKSLVEEVYSKATTLKQWSIVRHCAGVLRKVVNSLTINVADLLIRQRPISVGFGHGNEFSINAPMNPKALIEIIYDRCASDVREAPLVQEVLTYLGSFIRSQPSLFEGIMRLRTHLLIIAMRDEIARMKLCDEAEAVEQLMQLSPFEMKSLLGQVLSAKDQVCFAPDQISPAFAAANRWQLKIAQASQTDPEASLARSANLPLPNTLFLGIQSAGFSAGNFCRIEICRDDQLIPLPGVVGRGLNVVILDPFDGAIVEFASFDVHTSTEDSEDLGKLLQFLEPGMIFVMGCKDDCAERLTPETRLVIEAVGSAYIKEVKYRDSWAIIGEKGATDTVVESYAPATQSARITRKIDLAARRKKLVSSMGVSPQDVVGGYSSVAHALLLPSNGWWFRRRKNDGALNRVPERFYPRVWKILSKVNGIMVGKSVLPRDPTVSEKTPEEPSFADQVESLLSVIRDPAERQIVVECLVVIARIGERNPEIQIKDETLDVLSIVRDAITRSWSRWVEKQQAEHAGTNGDRVLNKTDDQTDFLGGDISFERNERLARRMFFDLPADGKDGTMAVLASSCVRVCFDVKWQSPKYTQRILMTGAASPSDSGSANPPLSSGSRREMLSLVWRLLTPMNMFLITDLLIIVVAGAILFMVLNAIFTLNAVLAQPSRLAFLYRAWTIRFRADETSAGKLMDIKAKIQTTYGKPIRVVPHSRGKSLQTSIGASTVEEPETTTSANTFWWIVVLLNLNCLLQYPMTVCMWGWAGPPERYSARPSYIVYACVPLSFSCGIIAGIWMLLIERRVKTYWKTHPTSHIGTHAGFLQQPDPQQQHVNYTITQTRTAEQQNGDVGRSSETLADPLVVDAGLSSTCNRVDGSRVTGVQRQGGASGSNNGHIC